MRLMREKIAPGLAQTVILRLLHATKSVDDFLYGSEPSLTMAQHVIESDARPIVLADMAISPSSMMLARPHCSVRRSP
jgi:hypothetical protein